DGSIIAQYLRGEGWVNWGSFEWMSLTNPEGRREAERIRDARIVQKEERVFDMIYNLSDLSGKGHRSALSLDVLIQQLGIREDEIRPILGELEERGLVRAGSDSVQITPKGRSAAEARHREGSPPGDTYHVSIGTLHGGVQQGPGNTQNITV